MAEQLPDSNLEDIKSRIKERASKKPLDLSTQLYGKLPPNARDLEEAILGAILIERNAITTAIEILSVEAFYVPAHQEIFKAMRILFDNTQPIDMLTVTEQLRKMAKLEEVGGAYYISVLSNKVSSSAHLEFYSRIVVQKYIMRELIKISNQIQKDAYEETTDVFDLLDTAEKSLYDITSKNLKKDYEGLNMLLYKSLKNIENLKESQDGLTLGAVPSGFTELDRITSGWQKSDLIICAARPGMGKTAFVLSLARNAAITGKKAVAIFSLEMASLQLVNRLISSETGLSSDKLKKGNLEPHEWQQLQSKIGPLSEAQIFIDDTAQLNIFELRAKCRRLVQQHNVEMVIIDYLQLMHAGNSENKGMNREQEISSISRNLKALAKELDIPVIALAQLSRAPEQRGGLKKPQLSDLRESGSIEQDADIVMFLYRPEYYGFLEDAQGNSLKSVAEIIIAKHRNGSTGNVQCKFVDFLSKFVDFDPITERTEFDMNINVKDKMSNVTIKQSRMNDMDDNPW